MSDENRQNSCSQRPCLSRPYHHPPDPSEDVNAELRGKPILYTGVIWIGILRRFLIPQNCVTPQPPLNELPTSMSEPQSRESLEARSVSHVPGSGSAEASNPAGHKLLKNQAQPTQATLLSNKRLEMETLARRRREMLKNNNPDMSPSPLVALLSQVKEVSVVAAGQARRLSEDLVSLVRNSKNLTSESITALREEEAVVLRWGMVTAGGLVGYISGLPRGLVPRLVFSVTGATASAVICYPAEAKLYNQQGLAALRRCLVYTVTTLKQGPRRSLGSGDTNLQKKPDPKHTTQPNVNSKQQNLNNSPPTDNTFKQSKDKVNTDQYQVEDGASPNVFNGQNTNVPPNYTTSIYTPAPTTLQTGPKNSNRRLSSQCQPGEGRPSYPAMVPYTPALPSPPNTKQNPTNKEEVEISQNTPIKAPQNPTIYPPISVPPPPFEDDQNQTFSENFQSTNDAFGYKSRDSTYNNSSKIHQEFTDRNNSESHAKPLEIDTQNLLGQGEVSQKPLPLNKKLSQYYIKKGEKTNRRPTSETGYEDLFPERN